MCMSPAHVDLVRLVRQRHLRSAERTAVGGIQLAEEVARRRHEPTRCAPAPAPRAVRSTRSAQPPRPTRSSPCAHTATPAHLRTRISAQTPSRPAKNPLVSATSPPKIHNREPSQVSHPPRAPGSSCHLRIRHQQQTQRLPGRTGAATWWTATVVLLLVGDRRDQTAAIGTSVAADPVWSALVGGGAGGATVV